MSEVGRLRIRVDRVGPADVEPALTLVLLPAAASTADDFVREGFFDDLEALRIPLSVVRSEVPIDLYAGDRMLGLLREQVLPTAHLDATPLWLAGISLGGMTALACAEAHRDRVAGVIAIAPWPGLRPLWEDVPAAGGTAAWAAKHIDAPFEDERRVWRWLGQGAPGGPAICIGYGRQDRFAEGQQLLGDALLPASRLLVDGAHDWPTWRVLWQQLLSRTAPRWRTHAGRAPGGPR